jgi:3alpha(or 20beta)-hydroxysteroid dehydrogenase
MARLDGKVILISGGARGQGAAEARLCVAEGARVVIGDVLEAEGRRLASELGNLAAFVRQDVTLESDWQKAIDRPVRWVACTAWSTMPASINQAR